MRVWMAEYRYQVYVWTKFQNVSSFSDLLGVVPQQVILTMTNFHKYSIFSDCQTVDESRTDIFTISYIAFEWITVTCTRKNNVIDIYLGVIESFWELQLHVNPLLRRLLTISYQIMLVNSRRLRSYS